MSQISPPSVSITNIDLDEGAGTAIIHFDLDQPEGSVLTVDLRASFDGGITFIEGPLDLSGDVGENIPIGNGRSITWNFGPIENIQTATIQLIAYDDEVPSIQQMVDQVDPDRLMTTLEQIAIPRHHSADPAGLQLVRDSIEQIFQQIGLQTSIHTVNYSGAQADNILGRRPGLIDPAKTFIVDGHYDAVEGTPGADDNATAVAATLEIARVLSQYHFKNSLRFIGFAFEEEGIVGAQQYAQNGINAWEEIHGVLNMEMIGYYSDQPNSQTMPPGFDQLFPAVAAELAANENRGDFLTIVGNTASDPLNNIFATASEQYVPQLKRVVLSVPGNGQIAPDLRRSDHAPFWDAGMQALMLTDGSNYRNPNYHLASDDVSTIHPEFFINCTKAVLAAAAKLAEPINAGMDSRTIGEFVGVHEHGTEFPCAIAIHPNPATDRISIELGSECGKEKVIATLFDLEGKRLNGATLKGSGSHEFSLKGIATGTYLLVLKSGAASTSIKIEIK